MATNLNIEILVSYDIEDNKARTQLFETLKDFGLRPIQKSVFWGTLIHAEYREVKRLVKDHLKPADRALVIQCQSDNKKRFEAFNYSPEDFVVKTNESI